jgi:hypothetical protein
MSDREREPEVPEDMSLRDAYAAVRSWYQGELEKEPHERQKSSEWWNMSKELIEALPEPGEATEGEIMFCFQQVSAGGLEFAFGGNDGRFSMGVYARTMLYRFPELAEIMEDQRS